MRRLLPCLALIVLIALVGAWWVGAAPFARFRGGANDPVFPRGTLDSGTVVVAIDDRTLVEVGEGWPWSRATLARLVDRLDAAGAEVIVLDLLLASETPDDAVLAASLRRAGNVVLAAAPLDVRSIGAGQPLRADDIVRPVPVLAAAAAAVGSSLAMPDSADGVLRHSALVVEDGRRRIVPALAVAAAAVADGSDTQPLLRRPHDVQVGDERWPTDDRYRMRISWPAGLDGAVISAADVLDGDAGNRSLRGRTVFVGATATALGDRWTTPVSGAAGTAGVVTHAAVHHTLASREFLGAASRTESILWVLVLAVVLVLAIRFLPLWAAGALAVVAVVGAVVAAYQRSTAGVLVDVIDLAVVPVLAVPGAGVLRYVAETRQRRRVTALFARFVPEPVVRQLVREGRIDDAVSGQRLDVSLLFCDLRGFTSIAAQLAPAEVNDLLTEFYEYVTERVHEHGGTVVQYVGDEVFAVFGAPVPTTDHAECALDAALDVQRGATALRRSLAATGLPDVGFGISVHSGEVVAGQAGSSRRRQYAVVGDTVNIASRLCGTAAAGELVVSDATLASARRDVVGERFEPDLRGVDRPLGAWRVAP